MRTAIKPAIVSVTKTCNGRPYKSKQLNVGSVYSLGVERKYPNRKSGITEESWVVATVWARDEDHALALFRKKYHRLPKGWDLMSQDWLSAWHVESYKLRFGTVRESLGLNPSRN